MNQAFTIIMIMILIMKINIMKKTILKQKSRVIVLIRKMTTMEK